MSEITTEERLVVVTDTFAKHIGQARYLAGVGVFTERTGDINQTLAIALNKMGLAITVIAPDADEVEDTGEALRMRVRLVAQIDETYTTNHSQNGLKKPALACVVAVMKAVQKKLNGLQPAGQLPVAGLHEFTLQEQKPYTIIRHPTRIVYQITAYTSVDL